MTFVGCSDVFGVNVIIFTVVDFKLFFRIMSGRLGKGNGMLVQKALSFSCCSCGCFHSSGRVLNSNSDVSPKFFVYRPYVQTDD